MTTAEKLREEGREKCRVEGLQLGGRVEGEREAALKLLTRCWPAVLIAQWS